jgi:WD40 repeat protein
MNLTKHWAAALEDYVIDLAWSPDGTSLAAASASGPVSIFSTQDGTRLHALPGHDEGTNAIAWKPGSAVLATGGQDGLVKFWDGAAGQHTASAELGSDWVEHLAWQPAAAPGKEARDPVLAATAGRKLRFLNSDASVRHAFKDAPKTLCALAWEPGGGALAAAYFGGVTIWDADDYIAQKEYPYTNGIHALVWSPDSRWIVSGNQDPSVHLWLPAQNDEFHMSGYEGKVKHLSFDHGSRWLATSGGQDVCLWDCRGPGPEGREPQMFPHDSPISAVAFQHRSSLLAAGSQDGVIMLWSPDRKQPLRATVKMPAAAARVAWSPDDQYLAIGSAKGVVYVLKCTE